MAYKMKALPPNTTLQDLFNHQSRTYRQLARIFHSGAAVTTKDLAATISMSMGSIQMAVKVFRELGLIHIVRWIKPTNGGTMVLAVYRAGQGKDAPKPAPLPQTQKRQIYREAQPEPPVQDTSIYQQLASALVPKRNEQEQHDVNWMYLNWISER